MFTVDRDAFIAWTHGILLERNAQEHIIVEDDIAHEKAESILARGEKVYLLSGNKVVSYLQLADEGFQEFEHKETN